MFDVRDSSTPGRPGIEADGVYLLWREWFGLAHFFFPLPFLLATIRLPA